MCFSYMRIDIQWLLFKAILVSLVLLVCVTGLFSNLSAESQSAKLVELETRPGVTQKFILIKPANPVASIILFGGGHGNIKLSGPVGTPSINKGKNKFLVRTRDKFAKYGFIVAVVDAPSDRKTGKGLLELNENAEKIFRMSDEHIQDIRAVVSYLKKEANIPVWLVGSSWGTASASNGAIEIKDGVDGLVLTSSVTRIPKEYKIHTSYPNGILNMGLDKIKVPTLIISHKNDKCPGTPSMNAPKLREALKNSPRTEILFFEGGKNPRPNYSSATNPDCQSQSPHGFYGLDKQVVSAIANFIKSNSQY